jgi:hypothetical protein
MLLQFCELVLQIANRRNVDAGNPGTDVELGAAGLLCALAEQLEQVARSLRDCESCAR